ncbi:MAG: GNAT family N-acetyltransferase [Planctomycetota bacterium]|nr:GNAT family N-acetyltransferase [Planctomycetota bacterium]MCX8039509.1 GNAT family N-acetyltransferase [Planctomycetota bacterium]MDW8373029.1 GNAT family N-acetyltransferase [Planctomycetota bacterium]
MTTRAAPAIRRAVLADLPAIVALLDELSPQTPLPLERARALFAEISATPNMHLWVADDGGDVVGTYTMWIMPNLGHGGAPLAIVESVVVAAARRGQGIGEALMRHAMAEARRAGCYKLALSSNGRRLDAHRFYRRLGFQPHGISFAIAP